MQKEKRRIGIRSIQCGVEVFTLYFTWSLTVAATLMMCTNCDELFIYDEDSILYGKPLSDQVAGKNCPGCNAKLTETLKKYYFDKTKIKCENPIEEVDVEGLIDVYNIYS